ncbi:DUF2079 domain-containing protein [Kocuria rhizophila]|uniref:DUF2079 domain-containing protein n=1 Tax=Kocuria rhizophila TaxID=72000 RepID=UPI001EF43A82|nr:DUF2079 domain-containing protein [Kocuria rhizophila]MCG7425791.1 DUF2079 domain-containing protein [Kocuria rhizophila]MCT1457538.1 DUF2079 domain-containing protein [Kocuria rhizophila]MCT1880761.1 DUF2079 domain-containing protein [Kocuria rhizophila]
MDRQNPAVPAVAPPVRGTRGAHWAWLLPVLVGSLATALYCALSWSQWIRWDVPSWDNAIFTQLLSSYAAGEGPVVDIKGDGFNLLGDHFHPLLIVLTPVYALFPSALTPMIVQNVLFGASAAVITRCAARAMHPAPAAAIGVAYALSFGLQNAVAVQFHEIALAVPLLATGLWALRERRWLAATLWCAPVALVKEDLGFTVAAVGALMLGHAARPAVRHRIPGLRRRWDAFCARPSRPGSSPAADSRSASSPTAPSRPGSSLTQTTPSAEAGAPSWPVPPARRDAVRARQELGRAASSPVRRERGSGARMSLRDPAVVCGAALVVWGVLVSALAVGVVLPALNPAGEFAYADKLDLAGLLRDPASAVILQVVPVQKLGTWALLLLAGAVVAVRSPIALVALPTLAWRMLSPNDGYWGAGWHYSAVLMPVVFVALVDAVVRLRGDSARAQQRLVSGAARSGRRGRVEATALWAMSAAAPWCALIVALAVGTQLSLAQLASPEAWRPDPRADAKTAAVAEIPAGASVATDLSLMNALVSRADVHWIGNGQDPDPQYVVLDRSSETWGSTPPEDVAAYAGQVYGARYTVVSDEQNIVVARLEG